MSTKSHYETLGLPSCATSAQIKRSYRALALKWHPDKNRNQAGATEKFKRISEAFRVLSDENERAAYDRERVTGTAAPPRASHSARDTAKGGSRSDVENIFRSFFGSNFTPGSVPTYRPHRGKPLLTTKKLPCTLEELALGTTKTVRVSRRRCEGNAMRTLHAMLAVRVHAGFKSGTKITFENEGNQEIPDGPRGDIQFVIAERKHARFKREGDACVFETSVTLVQALVGHTLDIVDLYGESARLVTTSDSVIVPGTERRIAGRGFPNRKRRCKGDLVVRFTSVRFPKVVPPERAPLLEAALRDLQ